MRYAIYTRKCTEEGLEQDFNSLDAQRESAENYIASQRDEGWVCLPDQYDDGGFTGDNMERPALQRLLADIEAGKIDRVLVYKVDRITRSLMDFAKMMETFDMHKASFVSVTQQFNSINRPVRPRDVQTRDRIRRPTRLGCGWRFRNLRGNAGPSRERPASSAELSKSPYYRPCAVRSYAKCLSFTFLRKSRFFISF